jgi:tRNA wybutosine-synthesizing protein 1
MSTERLKAENMLEMSEVRTLSENLCSKLKCFSTMDESEISRIVVLQNLKRYTDRWIKEYLIKA